MYGKQNGGRGSNVKRQTSEDVLQFNACCVRALRYAVFSVLFFRWEPTGNGVLFTFSFGGTSFSILFPHLHTINTMQWNIGLTHPLILYN